MMIYDYVL